MTNLPTYHKGNRNFGTGYDMIDRIEALEAENNELNEQVAAIEEYGMESLNDLPDCLMKLAPALGENDKLKAKLAAEAEAFRVAMDGLNGLVDSNDAFDIARATLAEQEGE